jgi:hypothetical protein
MSLATRTNTRTYTHTGPTPRTAAAARAPQGPETAPPTTTPPLPPCARPTPRSRPPWAPAPLAARPPGADAGGAPRGAGGRPALLNGGGWCGFLCESRAFLVLGKKVMLVLLVVVLIVVVVAPSDGLRTNVFCFIDLPPSARTLAWPVPSSTVQCTSHHGSIATPHRPPQRSAKLWGCCYVLSQWEGRHVRRRRNDGGCRLEWLHSIP